MPSDCQCSTHVETKIVKEVLNNKEATRRLKRLEEEVAELKQKNASLTRRLRVAKVSKKQIVDDLKKKLSNL